jgi:hypothetical protein
MDFYGRDLEGLSALVEASFLDFVCFGVVMCIWVELIRLLGEKISLNESFFGPEATVIDRADIVNQRKLLEILAAEERRLCIPLHLLAFDSFHH